jgi:hypothetical protein
MTVERFMLSQAEAAAAALRSAAKSPGTDVCPFFTTPKWEDTANATPPSPQMHCSISTLSSSARGHFEKYSK